MKEALTEILRSNSEDGKIRRRDVVSFALLLMSPAAVLVGTVAGPGAVQQVMSLAAILALVVSLRLVVKPARGARAVYILGAATSVLTFVAGISTPLNGGSLTLEPACTALLITAVPLFAARMKGSRSTGATAPAYSVG